MILQLILPKCLKGIVSRDGMAIFASEWLMLYILYTAEFPQVSSSTIAACLKVHKNENFFDFDFGICVISLLVMSKY